MKNKKSEPQYVSKNTLEATNTDFFKALNVFKLNTNGRLVFKTAPPKLVESNAIIQNFQHYSLKQINKVMKVTNPLLIDPDSAEIAEIERMLAHAWSRTFIPTFYGNVEGMTDDMERFDMRNFKTLSFGVFTGANPDRTTTDFIFAYFSQSDCEHQLDDELEGFRTELGKFVSIVDTLNDMFGVTSGVDYRLFHTLKIDQLPKLKAMINGIYEAKPGMGDALETDDKMIGLKDVEK